MISMINILNIIVFQNIFMSQIFVKMVCPLGWYFTEQKKKLIRDSFSKYYNIYPEILQPSYELNKQSIQTINVILLSLKKQDDFNNCHKVFSKTTPYLAVLHTNQKNLENLEYDLNDQFNDNFDDVGKVQEIDDQKSVIRIEEPKFLDSIVNILHKYKHDPHQFISQLNYKYCMTSKHIYQAFKNLQEFLENPSNENTIKNIQNFILRLQKNPPNWIDHYKYILDYIYNNSKTYHMRLTFDKIYQDIKYLIRQLDISKLTNKQNISYMINPHKNLKNFIQHFSNIRNIFHWKLGLDSNIFNQTKFIDRMEGIPNKNDGICSGLCYLVRFLLYHPQNNFNIYLVKSKITHLYQQSIIYQKSTKYFHIRRYFNSRQNKIREIYGLILQIQKLTWKNQYFEFINYNNAEKLLKDALNKNKNVCLIISYQVTPKSGHLVMLVVKDKQFYHFQPNDFNLCQISEYMITIYLTVNKYISGLWVHNQLKNESTKDECQKIVDKINSLLNQLSLIQKNENLQNIYKFKMIKQK